jgi:quinol-cytochrome oxidoreductase complex cytochrome b subunit
MGDLLLLSFAIALILGGFALMAYTLLGVMRDNYRPKHTRSTYLPPKR